MLEGANPTTPYMMLKSCTGDRALGWDLLPPGTNRSSYTDATGAVWTCKYTSYHSGIKQAPNGGSIKRRTVS
jgi:hypothetical protein